jgi:hypothetical protein
MSTFTERCRPNLREDPRPRTQRAATLVAFVLLMGMAVIGAAPAQAITPQGTLDANNLGAEQLSTTQLALSSGSPLAQTFTPTRSGELTSAQVTMFLFTPGDPPTDPISLEIADLNGDGYPVEPALATAVIPASAVTAKQPAPGVPPNPASLVTGAFNTPAAVVAGHHYALVLRTTSSLNYAVSLADGSSYPEGTVLFGSQYVAGGWFQISSYDMIFATYIGAPVTSFGTFSPIVGIDRNGKKPARLQAGAAFSLGEGSDGLSPATEDITLSVNGYSLTVPAGEVGDLGNGRYAYVGTISGAQVVLALKEVRPLNYLIGVQVLDSGLPPLANPLQVALTIGNDTGAAQISAKIF